MLLFSRGKVSALIKSTSPNMNGENNNKPIQNGFTSPTNGDPKMSTGTSNVSMVCIMLRLWLSKM